MKAVFNFIILFIAPLLLAQGPAELDSLLREGIKARSNKDYAKSLELLTEVRTVAEENNWYKQQFLAINNIGANYYSVLDYGEALDNYLEAYTIAIKHLDENEEMIVLNNIAILYSKEGDLIKAEEYFKKAYNLAQEQNEKIKIGLYAVNLGIVANQQGRLDVAAAYLKEAMEMLRDEPTIYILAEIALAENYYKRKELHKAKFLAETTLPKLESIALSEERISVLLLLSNIAKEMGDIEMAVAYGKTALEAAANPENRISAYQQLAEIYTDNALYGAALNAKDSVIVLTDSLNQLKNGRLFETSRVKFEIADYRRELQRSREIRKQERTTLYSLLGVSLLIILLSAWALYNSYIKNKQRKILHQQSKEFIELELQKKQSDNLLLEKQLHAKETLALLEEERLRNEIEARNRKLAAKALQISGRNELLKEVINTLSGQTEVAKNALLSKKVKELKGLLKRDNEWESFLTHFEEVNHGLITKLRANHPELTTNDIRFLSYLYMDLTTKEIASLFNITVEATRKRKERISIKMGLEDSAALYKYITAL
ncbi:tetratricopeptide repeat protein [Aequorivita sp. SDUM287046]|uniref:Tetratricopeptide repeat protein n=1 Tax=Aequorivita aurantiaca TaxID=3053356 RepID=A0ABT8DJI9_9FLAO|nr:tetratricopeptide repeat protein [Aequorivita aurantiaca]MDN3725493.1 tetratricopeptide repeat protein [Aequorivita aurantiaca]